MDYIKADIEAIQAILENPEGHCCGKVSHRYKTPFDAVAGHLVSVLLAMVEADPESVDNNYIDWIEHYILN